MESPTACFTTWSRFWFSFSHFWFSFFHFCFPFFHFWFPFSHFWFPFSHFWFSINSFISFIRKPSAKQAAEQATFQLQRPVFECSFKDMLDIIDNCRKLDYMRFPRMMQDSVTDAVDSGGNATELGPFGKEFYQVNHFQSLVYVTIKVLDTQSIWLSKYLTLNVFDTCFEGTKCVDWEMRHPTTRILERDCTLTLAVAHMTIVLWDWNPSVLDTDS